MVIDSDGLYIDTIGVKLSWSEIKYAKATQNYRYGTVIKIYLNDDVIINNSTSLNRILWNNLSEFIYNTPVIFNTIFVRGKPIDLYITIQNKIALAK